MIVSIVGGGMRRYLAHHDDLPGDKSLIALLPVSVREKGREIEGGNEVSTMVVSIGTDTDDPIKRLKQVHSRTQRAVPLAKEVVIKLGRAANDMIPAYMHNMLTWAMTKLEITSKRPTVNTLITNVPGPSTRKYFAGAPIVSVHPTVSIQDGIGITHFILGIEDVLSMGVLSDRAVMKDIDFYIECMQESTPGVYRSTGTAQPETKTTNYSTQGCQKKKEDQKESSKITLSNAALLLYDIIYLNFPGMQTRR